MRLILFLKFSLAKHMHDEHVSTAAKLRSSTSWLVTCHKNIPLVFLVFISLCTSFSSANSIATFGSDLITAKEFATARQVAEAEIERIERETTKYDPALFEPLLLLAEAEYGSSNYLPSLMSFERARYIVRMNEGFKTETQIAVFRREADVHLRMGDKHAANDSYELAYAISRFLYGKSPEIVDEQIQLADWYRKNKLPHIARDMYDDAIEILVSNESKDHQKFAQLYNKLGLTYREHLWAAKGQRFSGIVARPDGRLWGDPARRGCYGGFTPPAFLSSVYTGPAAASDPMSACSAKSGSRSGAYWRSPVQFLGVGGMMKANRAFKTAQKHYELSQSAVVDDVVGTILDRGDTLILYKSFGRAYKAYEEAYEYVLEHAPGRINEYFEEPVVIFRSHPGDSGNRSSGEPFRSEIDFVATVNHRGAVRKIKTERKQPQSIRIHAYRKAARSTRFRPAIRNGRPALVNDVKITFKFRSYPS